MPSRVVGLPRAQAIQLAQYERDSLELRARSSRKCPWLWRAAAKQADLAVRHLLVGNDRAARSAALRVAPAWKRAADCEGWPTPVGALTAPQEDKIDRILRLQKEEAAKRKVALMFGALGALFAAAKLGIVAIPLVQSARRRPK